MNFNWKSIPEDHYRHANQNFLIESNPFKFHFFIRIRVELRIESNQIE